MSAPRTSPVTTSLRHRAREAPALPETLPSTDIQTSGALSGLRRKKKYRNRYRYPDWLR